MTSPTTASVCPNCGTPGDNRRFCIACGTALTLQCPSCGTQLASGVRFCGNCGGPIAQPESAPRPAAGSTNQNLLPIIAVVLLVGAAAFFFLSQGGDSEDNSIPTFANEENATVGSEGSKADANRIPTLLSITPIVPTNLKTGAEATLSGGPDQVLSDVVERELKKEGLDTTLLKPSVWPIPGTEDNLLVFNADQGTQVNLSQAQQDAQTNAFRRTPTLPIIKTARITRVAFVIRNFPQAGKTATLSFDLPFLARMLSGGQVTEAEIRQQVLYQVKP